MRKIIFVLLCLFMQQAIAGSFVAPETIAHEGKEYKLAYEKKTDRQELYEYTTNNEKIERWSSLVTINYFKSSSVESPKEWTTNLAKTLMNEKPRPHYDVYFNASNGYAIIIYEPNFQYETVEANVHKSFHLDNCSGVVIYQYAQPFKSHPNSEDQKAQLRDIAKKTRSWAASMEKDKWVPSCK